MALKSSTSAVTGVRINPNQKTGEESSKYDMPVMLAARGRVGQK